MNRLIKFSLFCASVLTSIAFAGCTDDITTDSPVIGGEDGVFTFVVDDFDIATEDQGTSATTKAADGEPSSEIANLWVVQYDNYGENLNAEYIEDYSESSTITLKESTTTIAFIANTFNYKLVFGLYAALEDALIYDVDDLSDILGKKDANGDRYFIMSGEISGYTYGTKRIVSLKRNISKVNIKVTEELDDSYTLSNIVIHNINQKSNLYPDWSNLPSMPPMSSMGDLSYTLTSSELTAASGAGATIYLPTNIDYAVNDNKTEQDKVTNATYLDATYVVVEFIGDFYKRSYTFYLGADEITDYNLKRNCIYNNTFHIAGEGNALSDPRVDKSIAYIPMANAADIDRWKERNVGNTDALANYNNYGKKYIDFKYSVGEVEGTNWMSTSEVISLYEDKEANASQLDDDFGIYDDIDVSGDVLPQLQAICGKSVELPTQKELMYMYIFKGSNSFFSYYYWSSAVDSDSSSRWYVIFGNGDTNSFGNGDTSRFSADNHSFARAVREIELPQAD